MKTDYETTGKTYPPLEAYTKAAFFVSQAMPTAGEFYYFGSTIQFKTCKSFKAYLEQKHKGHIFKVQRGQA